MLKVSCSPYVRFLELSITPCMAKSREPFPQDESWSPRASEEDRGALVGTLAGSARLMSVYFVSLCIYFETGS
jgi:hypothetical protein